MNDSCFNNMKHNMNMFNIKHNMNMFNMKHKLMFLTLINQKLFLYTACGIYWLRRLCGYGDNIVILHLDMSGN